MDYKWGKSNWKTKKKAFGASKSKTGDIKSVQNKREPSKVLGMQKPRGSRTISQKMVFLGDS